MAARAPRCRARGRAAENGRLISASEASYIAIERGSGRAGSWAGRAPWISPGAADRAWCVQVRRVLASPGKAVQAGFGAALSGWLGASWFGDAVQMCSVRVRHGLALRSPQGQVRRG